MESKKIVILVGKMGDHLHEVMTRSHRTFLEDEEKSRLLDILRISGEVIKDHSVYIERETERWEGTAYKITEAMQSLNYILDLLTIQAEMEKPDKKLLQSAEEKLAQAGVSFDKEDYGSCLNSLNSCLELALKDELDIPKTISKINTRKIIEVCLSESLGPVQHLKEAIKHILEIDNKIKHTGYSAGKLDCINAITAMEGLLTQLKKHPVKLTEAAQQKVFSGI